MNILISFPAIFPRLFGIRALLIGWNVESTSIDCQQEQVPLPRNSQHLSVVEQAAGGLRPTLGTASSQKWFHLKVVHWLDNCANSSLLYRCGFAVRCLYFTQAKCFLPSLLHGTNLVLKLRENVEMFFSHQSSPPPCFILVVR